MNWYFLSRDMRMVCIIIVQIRYIFSRYICLPMFLNYFIDISINEVLEKNYRLL